jgi:hypothetical protein
MSTPAPKGLTKLVLAEETQMNSAKEKMANSRETGVRMSDKCNFHSS